MQFGDYTAEEVLQNMRDPVKYRVILEKRLCNMPMPKSHAVEVSALNAWIRDLLFGSGGTPFTVGSLRQFGS